MKILLIGDFSFGSLGLSYLKAFEKSGCQIFKFDLTNQVGNKYLNKLSGYLFYPVINKRLLDEIKLNEPDLVFIIKGSCIFPETIIKIQNDYKSKVFCYNPDNPFNLNKGASNELIRKSISQYDCYFIWGKFLIPELVKTGSKQVEYVPFAYDPELHHPVDFHPEDKTVYGSDIAFIGSWDKEREYWLENIAKYDLAIWGNSWEKLTINSPLRKKWKRKEVVGEDFSKVCASSKIILNLVRKQNENAHNMRTFEVPACKGFMLTTRTKEQCEFFEEDKEIGCFETPDELIDKLEKYLPDQQFREKASLAAYNKVKQNTYVERVKIILDCYKKLKK